MFIALLAAFLYVRQKYPQSSLPDFDAGVFDNFIIISKSFTLIIYAATSRLTVFAIAASTWKNSFQLNKNKSVLLTKTRDHIPNESDSPANLVRVLDANLGVCLFCNRELTAYRNGGTHTEIKVDIKYIGDYIKNDY